MLCLFLQPSDRTSLLMLLRCKKQLKRSIQQNKLRMASRLEAILFQALTTKTEVDKVSEGQRILEIKQSINCSHAYILKSYTIKELY